MSQAQSPLALEVHFAKLHDPRRAHLRRHLLIDILILTICATICGANDCQQIAAFGRRREDWLRKFLKLENGIPSHDTIERVLDLLKPDAFQSCFRSWVKTLQTDEDLPHIAIDGKTVRGSARGSQKALHVVSAFATANGVSLGQVAVDEKSNEIPAIPELLQVLELKGALVTLDAMGCQKEIAAKIVEGGGDYVLTVKDNQPKSKESIETYFEKAQEQDYAGMTYSVHETEEKGHGREELRRVEVIRNPAGFDSPEWKGLKVIGMCYRERVEKGQRKSGGGVFYRESESGSQSLWSGLAESLVDRE